MIGVAVPNPEMAGSVHAFVHAAENIPLTIKQLAELEDQGILTQDEFCKKKIELLAKM